jgi:hypothetical protein
MLLFGAVLHGPGRHRPVSDVMDHLEQRADRVTVKDVARTPNLIQTPGLARDV